MLLGKLAFKPEKMGFKRTVRGAGTQQDRERSAGQRAAGWRRVPAAEGRSAARGRGAAGPAQRDEVRKARLGEFGKNKAGGGMTDAYKLRDGQVPFKLRSSTAWDCEPCPHDGWE